MYTYCTFISNCFKSLATLDYLKQGHVFPIILLAFLYVTGAAVDKGAALLGCRISCEHILIKHCLLKSELEYFNKNFRTIRILL